MGCTWRPPCLTAPTSTAHSGAAMDRQHAATLAGGERPESAGARFVSLCAADQRKVRLAEHGRLRDVASVRGGSGPIDQSLVGEALSLHRVDHRGLDASDRRLLQLLIQNHGGGPVGLETLAAALGDDPVTLETVVEPFLLQQGLLVRTPRGRMVTDAARSHLAEAA